MGKQLYSSLNLESGNEGVANIHTGGAFYRDHFSLHSVLCFLAPYQQGAERRRYLPSCCSRNGLLAFVHSNYEAVVKGESELMLESNTILIPLIVLLFAGLYKMAYLAEQDSKLAI